MIDYKEMLARQAAVSRATFGPGERRNGVIQHILKELEEFKAEGDPEEACDIVILAHDLLLRCVASLFPEQSFDQIASMSAQMVKNKLMKNEKRVWPDWRQYDQDTAIEHDRSYD